MSNFHNAMTNIDRQFSDSQFPNHTANAWYSEGHKDARHSAAEIALDADKRIAELEEALRFMVDRFDEPNNKFSQRLAITKAKNVLNLQHAHKEVLPSDARIEKLETFLQDVANGEYCDLRSVEQSANNVLKW